MTTAKPKELTDPACRNAKPRDKPWKLHDVRGLFLLVNPTGTKWWRLRYKLNGKDGLMSLGVYPDVPLADARKLRDKAREVIAQGVNPAEARKDAKAATGAAGLRTFGVLAEQWFKAESVKWRSKTYVSNVRRILDVDVLPFIGKRPITEIKPRELKEVFQRIKATGREETARRTRVLVGQVFRAAVGDGLAEIDPTQSLPREKRVKAKKHHAAFTDPTDVTRLMKAIGGYSGSPEVCAALKLSALLFQRPGEIRHMQWPQLDLDAALWRYTVTKTMTPHIVPLSAQAVAVLRALHPLTGHAPTAQPDGPHYVLPGARSRYRPLSENAVRVALRTMGFGNDEMTPHGFRAMARTLLAELGWKTDAIERQLSHKVAGPLGAAYDRAQFLDERRRMMQAWADYLDSLASGSKKVVALRRA